MSADRPINADVPVPDQPEPKPAEERKPDAEATPAGPKPVPTGIPPSSKPKPRRRQPIPGALKAIAALVVVAIAFIVAAVVGGSGGSKSSSETAAPAPVAGGAGDDSQAAATSESSEQLGYPAFATGNTTRVGGSDPATNAAAVALAVFPATTPAQRPAAVTLVGEEDWAGAIAGAVLMSAPVRAPLLFSSPDELPEASAAALDALDPQGDRATGGAVAFSIGSLAGPGGDITTLKAGDAATTAAAVAKLRDRLFGSPPAQIVVAPSNRPDFASPAAAWAARSGDPVLFAAGDEVPPATLAVLERHPKVPVYVLGPSSAISSKAVRAIAAAGGDVHRVSGEDPVANAIAFARYADGGFGWNVNDPGHGFVLARDDAPLDTAAAAPLSASGTWGPLLLSDSATSLPAPLREYFLDVKPGYTTNPTRAFYNHVWVIGDQEAIDVNQQAEVNELAELAKIGGGE
jgi:hypothetical protein